MIKRRRILNFISFIFILIEISSLSSCSSEDPVIDNSEDIKDQEEIVATAYEPLPLSPAQAKTSKAMEEFASKYLLAAIETEKNVDGNVIVSPIGLDMILTMLSNGMDESAVNELCGVLGVNEGDLNSLYTLLKQKFAVADNQVEFSLANSLWVNNGVNINESFSNLLKDSFDAETYCRALATDKTKTEINQWCSLKTNGMIPNFLESNLDPNTFLFIVNALYFNGKWSKPFDKADTKDATFTSISGKPQQVKMMNSTTKVYYSELNDGGEIISIPYGNGSFLLNIYLPAEGEDLQNSLSKNIHFLSKGAFKTECELSIPKFTLAYKNERILDVIGKLGLKSIMSEGHLDNIYEKARIDFIQQSTALALSEDGAVAAAVTGGGVLSSNIGEEEPQIKKIVIDRPFAFSITEKEYDITLLSGVIKSLE